MPSDFTFRTGTFSNLTHEQLSLELDRALPRLYDAHASLNATAIKAPVFGSNFATNSGVATVKGSLLGIATGLATVNHVVASVATGATPSAFTISAQPSQTAGAIDIYVYQPTSSSVTTPVAGTSPVSVHWYATGTAVTTS